MGSANNKYYGYIRVSDETLADKYYSFECQQRALCTYCKQNNIVLSNIFADISKSGAVGDHDDLSNRTEAAALLQTMNTGDTVIAMNTSRLWGDDAAKVFICKFIRKLQGNIISIEHPAYSLYNKDPHEFLFNAIMDLLDQYDHMCAKQWATFGISQKQENFIGGTYEL